MNSNRVDKSLELGRYKGEENTLLCNYSPKLRMSSIEVVCHCEGAIYVTEAIFTEVIQPIYIWMP